MQLTGPARQVRSVDAAVRRPSGLWWLVGLAAAFTIAQLAFVPPRMGLGWDEVVYISQVSAHAPTAYFDSTRARGLTLLVAPVELVTASFTALRVYLSVASGLSLLLALCAWRRVRPDWLLALAGVLFGGLWVAQFNGPQVMPDFWTALSALAAVGCAISLAAEYIFMIDDASARYLLPAYALLAILVADGLSWSARRACSTASSTCRSPTTWAARPMASSTTLHQDSGQRCWSGPEASRRPSLRGGTPTA